MSNGCRVLEGETPVRILGVTFGVDLKAYYDMPIGGFIEEAQHHNRCLVVEKYLNEKYEGFNGVPANCVFDELVGVPKKAIQNMLREHLGVMYHSRFLPVEQLAEYVVEREGLTDEAQD